MALGSKKVTKTICLFIVAITTMIVLLHTSHAADNGKPTLKQIPLEDAACEWWPSAPDGEESFHVGGGEGLAFTLVNLGSDQYYFQVETGYGTITAAGIAHTHGHALTYSEPHSTCVAEIVSPNKTTLVFKTTGLCKFPYVNQQNNNGVNKKEMSKTVYSCDETADAKNNIALVKSSRLFEEITRPPSQRE